MKELEIQKNKEIFLKIFRKYVNRKGREELLNWLEYKTDFFVAPASTKYHLNEDGGLCLHSLNLLKVIRTENLKKIPLESIVISCLCHDVCKANTYEKKKTYKGEEYYQWNEKFPFGHGEKSVFLIERFMKLTVDEAVAIRFHMGAEPNDNGASGRAYNDFPLAVYTHMADFESTFILESESFKSNNNEICINNLLVDDDGEVFLNEYEVAE